LPLLNSSEDSDDDGEERKRLTHVSAEQKRRDGIKTAFDSLKGLLPQFKSKGNVSKAVILKAAIEFISSQPSSHEEILRLRRENEELRKALRFDLISEVFMCYRHCWLCLEAYSLFPLLSSLRQGHTREEGNTVGEGFCVPNAAAFKTSTGRRGGEENPERAQAAPLF